MPIFHQQQLREKGELGLWQIEEPEEWFLERLSLHENEQAQLDKIKGHRRIEWLAARQLVHQMSGRERRGIFIKDEFGKPHLENTDWQISISHSRHIAAAIASPANVGIDIQKIVPKITRLIPKFMRPAEQESLEEASFLLHAHVYWGAKEALYKAYGRKELNFCQHILLEPFPYHQQGGICEGEILKGAFAARYQIHYQLLDEDYMLVYCIEL